MPYWLVKSEPSVFSWEKLEKEKKTVWDGVRNYAARNHLQSMKKGDKVLFYHSNEGTAIIGIAIVVKEYFQDPTTDNTNWVAVALAPVEPLHKPVTLAQVKADNRLAGMALVRLGRLSVQPVTHLEWDIIMELAAHKNE